MNSLPKASQLNVPGQPRQPTDGAGQKMPTRAAPPAAKGGLKLSVATLTVISGLSIGLVTSWALVTEMRTTAKPAAHASAPTTAREQKTTPAEAPVAARAPAPVTAAEQQPAPSEPPAVAEPSPLPVRTASAEVVKTGSIKPPRVSEPGLIAMTAEAAPVKPEAAVTVKAEPAALKAPEPKAQPREAAAAAPQAHPTITSAEGNAYLAKAEAALRIGDLAVARLFFGRLAEAGDARGAAGMARTYDDSELKKLPVFGLKGERAEAERWQARARELTAKSAYARN